MAAAADRPSFIKLIKRGKVRLPVRRALHYELLCSLHLIRVKPNICLSLGNLCAIAATDSCSLWGDAERHRGLLRVQIKGCCDLLIELIVGRHAARCSSELQRFLPLFTQLSRTLSGLLRFHSASNVFGSFYVFRCEVKLELHRPIKKPGVQVKTDTVFQIQSHSKLRHTGVTTDITNVDDAS